jgi:hypothetical protein
VGYLRDATIEELLGKVFSMRFLPRLSKEGSCDYVRALRRQLQQELVVRQSPASKDVNTEAVEATALEAVTRRQHVKTQQNEKTSYVLY